VVAGARRVPHRPGQAQFLHNDSRNRARFASVNEIKAYLLSRSQLAEHFTVCSSISAFL